MKLLKIGFYFIFLLGIAPLFNVCFAGDFWFDYSVNYTVAETGKTRVEEKITLTNKLTEVFAQNYSVVIASEKLDTIRAFDASGELTPEVHKKNGETTITIPFATKALGVNKQLPFSLTYDSYDIAQKNGTIWEIIIPGINREDVRTYTVSLHVPEGFGAAAYYSPDPGTDGVWDLAEHNGNGLTAAYGEKQQFWFRLKYHLLGNEKDTLQEITLPPDTAFQKVVLTQISEPPENVTQDADGNWLAQFRVPKNAERDITVEGNVTIFSKPRVGIMTDLTADEVITYTKSLPFWDQTPEIQAVAAKFTTPEEIYQYVVDTLEYNYERVTPGIERLGAPYVLENPNDAVCMEFSDLFVALSRAAGIPARVNHGYAYTTNARLQPLSLVSDVLHAWPEYYDAKQKLWIPVDPTWGDTTRGVDYFHKLDFNHITFAILGLESDYPYPAGAFRSESSQKDVFVEFTATPMSDVESEATVELLPQRITSGFTQQATLRMYNQGTTLFQAKNVELTQTGFSLSNATNIIIPPYGHRDLPVTVSLPLSLVKKMLTVPVQINTQQVSFTVQTIPIYESVLPYIVGVIFLIGLLRLLKIRLWRKN